MLDDRLPSRPPPTNQRLRKAGETKGSPQCTLSRDLLKVAMVTHEGGWLLKPGGTQAAAEQGVWQANAMMQQQQERQRGSSGRPRTPRHVRAVRSGEPASALDRTWNFGPSAPDMDSRVRVPLLLVDCTYQFHSKKVSMGKNYFLIPGLLLQGFK